MRSGRQGYECSIRDRCTSVNFFLFKRLSSADSSRPSNGHRFLLENVPHLDALSTSRLEALVTDTAKVLATRGYTEAEADAAARDALCIHPRLHMYKPEGAEGDVFLT